MGEHIHNVTGWIAGWNLPGYRPVTDEPLRGWETCKEALEYLQGEAYNRAQDYEENDREGDRWEEFEADIRRELNKLDPHNPPDTIYLTAPDGYRWFVEVQTDCDNEESADGNVLIAGVLYGPDGYEAEPIEED